MTSRKVYLILLALLGLTVGLAYLPLSFASKPASLLIAATKSGLVMYYFMDLRDAKPIIRLSAFAGLAFLVILFGITFSDYLNRGVIGVLGK